MNEIPDERNVTSACVCAMLMGMSTGRVTLIVTCVVSAGLGGWFVMAKWDQANRVATVLAALAGLAAVGVAIWAATRTSASPGTAAPAGRVKAFRLGKAKASGSGSNAVSGVQGKSGSTETVRLRDSGDAQAENGGNAVSGVQLD